MRRAVELTTANGTVTAIVRADRVAELSAEGVVTVLPFAPHEGEPPRRAIVLLRKSAPDGTRMLVPMILHRADGKPTDAAEAVLRGCPGTGDRLGIFGCPHAQPLYQRRKG